MADDVFPDRDLSHRDKIVFMLERQGWAIDAVGPSGDPEAPIPRFAYTIGLAPVACRSLFDLVADALAGGTELPVGPPFIGLLDGGQPCALLPVDVPAAAGMFPSLTEHHRLAGEPEDAFRMVQLAWPDGHGNLPWEPAFDPSLALAQLLLGDPPEG